MQVNKSLILFLLYTLQASDIIISTDSTDIPSSISSIDSKGDSFENPIEIDDSSSFISDSKGDSFENPIEIDDSSSESFDKQSNDNQELIEEDNHEIHHEFSDAPIEIFNDEFEAENVDEIDKALCEICQNDPINSHGIFHGELAKMIGGYKGPNSIKIIYNKIMKRLNLSGEEEKDLNLSICEFLKKFVSIIEKRENEFSLYNVFWADLNELLLKSIFYLRKKMIGATEDEFKNVTNDIHFINSILRDKFEPIVTEDFDFETMNDESFFSRSLNPEFFEHFDDLSSTMIEALKYVYLSPSNFITNEDGKRIANFNCDKFKRKFFGGANPNSKALLKLFMIECDKRGELIRNCLKFNIQSSDLIITEELTKQIEADIEKLESKEINHFIEIPEMMNANNSVMSFIQRKGIKVSIDTEVNAFWFLYRMKEANLMEKEFIETIAEFRDYDTSDPNQPYKWSPKLLDDNIKEYGMSNPNTEEENDLFNECLELFGLEPLQIPIESSIDGNGNPLSQ